MAERFLNPSIAKRIVSHGYATGRYARAMQNAKLQQAQRRQDMAESQLLHQMQAKQWDQAFQQADFNQRTANAKMLQEYRNRVLDERALSNRAQIMQAENREDRLMQEAKASQLRHDERMQVSRAHLGRLIHEANRRQDTALAKDLNHIYARDGVPLVDPETKQQTPRPNDDFVLYQDVRGNKHWVLNPGAYAAKVATAQRTVGSTIDRFKSAIIRLESEKKDYNTEMRAISKELAKLEEESLGANPKRNSEIAKRKSELRADLRDRLRPQLKRATDDLDKLRQRNRQLLQQAGYLQEQAGGPSPDPDADGDPDPRTTPPPVAQPKRTFTLRDTPLEEATIQFHQIDPNNIPDYTLRVVYERIKQMVEDAKTSINPDANQTAHRAMVALLNKIQAEQAKQ